MEPRSSDIPRRTAYPGLVLLLGAVALISGWARPQPAPPDYEPLRLDANNMPIPLLSCLPMVGRSLLDRIEAARADSGIRSLSDLDRIKGVGPRAVSLLKPFLTFEADEPFEELTQASSK